jgi:hypothetical protein
MKGWKTRYDGRNGAAIARHYGVPNVWRDGQCLTVRTPEGDVSLPPGGWVLMYADGTFGAAAPEPKPERRPT